MAALVAAIHALLAEMPKERRGSPADKREHDAEGDQITSEHASSPSIQFECLRTLRLAVHGTPDALGRRRHFHMAHPELAQRIDDRVDGDGERRRGAAFARRADAERMGRRRHFADAGVEEREYVRRVASG